MAKPSSKKPATGGASLSTSAALLRLRELAKPETKPKGASAKSSLPVKSVMANVTKSKVEKATKPKVEKATKPKVEKATKPKVEKATKPKVEKATKLAESHALDAAPELSPGAGVLARVSVMLSRVPAEHVVPPQQPVPQLISEALALFGVARRYADKLAKIGFSDAMLDGLHLYAQALHEAQAKLDSHRGKHSTQAEQKLFGQAFDLRNQLLLAARLVLRKDRKVLESLDAIAEGEGLADLARDLLDLALVAESYPAQLSRLGIGVDTAYKARDVARKLTAKTESTATKTEADREAEELRNRAATVLQELMAEARLGGAYLFRKEPRLSLLFTATHLPRRGSR